MSRLLDSRTKRLGSIALPLILIGLGGALLLQSAGVLQISLWSLIWRVWPLVLVLIGIELVIGHRAPGLAVLIMAVLTAGVVAATLLGLGGPRVVSRVDVRAPRLEVRVSGGPDEAVTDAVDGSVAEPLAAVRRARLDLRFGAGELALSSLPPTSDLLIGGELAAGTGRNPPRFRVDRGSAGTEAAIEIRSGSGSFFAFNSEGRGERWDLQLSPKVPVAIEVRTGASHLDLDLTHLQVPDLDVTLGASEALLRLPLVGRTRASVDAGAAQITIEVPPDTAARVRVRGGLADIEVDQSRFQSVEAGGSGTLYQSEGFDLAPNRVDLEVKAGLAQVTVR